MAKRKPKVRKPKVRKGLKKLRLTLEVRYDLKGVDLEEMKGNLRHVVDHAMGVGMITGESEAEVDNWHVDVHEVPINNESVKVSQHLARFFAVEIRNEDEGGVRPATLGSAYDSWIQAPENVIDDWLGVRCMSVKSRVKAAVLVQEELKALLLRYGPYLLLQDCTDE